MTRRAQTLEKCETGGRRMQFSPSAEFYIGEVLVSMRAEAGMTQKEASKRSHVGWRSISLFERAHGRRVSGLTVAQLLALLNTYEVTLAEFETRLLDLLKCVTAGDVIRRSA